MIWIRLSCLIVTMMRGEVVMRMTKMLEDKMEEIGDEPVHPR